MNAAHPSRRNYSLTENSRSILLQGAGRLFFMRIIQNGNHYIDGCQDNHEFLVCTHIAPPPTGSERVQHVPQLPG